MHPSQLEVGDLDCSFVYMFDQYVEEHGGGITLGDPSLTTMHLSSHLYRDLQVPRVIYMLCLSFSPGYRQYGLFIHWDSIPGTKRMDFALTF